MNINELNKVLSKHHINTENWLHEKGTKTVRDLHHEIDMGETILRSINGQLFRVVRLVSLLVKFKLGEQLFTLVEDKQIFFAGGIRKRDLDTLAEKIKVDETPELAVCRCLKEEIGLDFDGSFIFLGESEEVKSSPSYPFLHSIYKVYNYQVILSEKELEFIRFSEYHKGGQKITLFTLEASN
ncbi:MAG: hypothetical protein ACXITR_01165 [Cyanobacterium sp.]